MHAKSLQSYPTVCEATDCSMPGPAVYGIFQAGILELPCPPPGNLYDPGIELGRGFPGSLDGKESAYSVGGWGSIPESGRSPGEGNGNSLQYSYLDNSMARGAW